MRKSSTLVAAVAAATVMAGASSPALAMAGRGGIYEPPPVTIQSLTPPPPYQTASRSYLLSPTSAMCRFAHKVKPSHVGDPCWVKVRGTVRLTSEDSWLRATSAVTTTGPFGVWTIKTSFGVMFNGVSLWSTWVDCQFTTLLDDLDVTWCGVAHDGAGGGVPADFGANWTVSFLLRGTPIRRTFYHRIAIDPTGTIVRIDRG